MTRERLVIGSIIKLGRCSGEQRPSLWLQLTGCLELEAADKLDNTSRLGGGRLAKRLAVDVDVGSVWLVQVDAVEKIEEVCPDGKPHSFFKPIQRDAFDQSQVKLIEVWPNKSITSDVSLSAI